MAMDFDGMDLAANGTETAVTYPGGLHPSSFVVPKGRILCGGRLCDTDFLYCCDKNNGRGLHCCPNSDKASSSNSFKWASWIGGGIVIAVVLFAAIFLLHRRSKASYSKNRAGRRRNVYAPAAGMAIVNRSSESSSVEEGADDVGGSECGGRAAGVGTSVAYDARMASTSLSVVSPTDRSGLAMTAPHAASASSRSAQPQLISDGQPIPPPPYSCTDGADTAVSLTETSSSLLTDEHLNHFVSVESVVCRGGHARVLPNYHDVVDATNATSSIVEQYDGPELMSQTSRHQLLPSALLSPGDSQETTDDATMALLPPPPPLLGTGTGVTGASSPVESPPAYSQ